MTGATTAIEVPRLQQPIDACVVMPGSKSHSNRAIVAACLANGRTELRGATPCDDVALLVDNLARMGFGLRWEDRGTGELIVDGGVPDSGAAGPVELDCELAGTTLRFLVGVACLVSGEWVVTGNARMRERPIGPLVAALRQLGAELEDTDGCPPVRVRGGSLSRGGATRLDASRSSQFLSALLLVGPKLPGGIHVELEGPLTSPGYVAMTERVLTDFGATVESAPSDGAFGSTGELRAPDRPYGIEADWSAAGTFVVLSHILGGGVRTFAAAMSESIQPDKKLLHALRGWAEPGDITIDATETPDQVMNLAVFAAQRVGRTAIRGARNLRHKESDRLAVITGELSKVGIRITEHEDGVDVVGPSRIRPATLDPHGDHRMAMAFAILASTAEGVRILDPDCVSKSFPSFFDELARLHAPRSRVPIALVGMRGSGKSTLAVDLADALGMSVRDSDAEFVAEHGPIAAFVAREGWESFREHEAQIVGPLFVPPGFAEVGRSEGPSPIVALGGGAIETDAVRAALRGEMTPSGVPPLVVWVRESVETLRERIGRDGGERPSLTGSAPATELEAVLARREPLYREVSGFELPPGLTREERVERVRAWLRSSVSFDKELPQHGVQ